MTLDKKPYEDQFKKIDNLLAIDVSDLFQVLEKNLVLTQTIKEIEYSINYYINQVNAEQIVSKLTDEQICKLIKIFTIIDKDHRSRGSTSVIPKLLDTLLNRQCPTAIELYDWVIKYNNRKNAYLPFGYIVGSEFKSYAEYLKYIEIENQNKIKNELLNAKIKQENYERIKLKAEKDIWKAIRRKDQKAIYVFIKRGINLNLKNQEGMTVKELIESLP